MCSSFNDFEAISKISKLTFTIKVLLQIKSAIKLSIYWAKFENWNGLVGIPFDAYTE